MLYIHDTRCKFVAMGPMGTWVEDTYGTRYLVYGHGKAAASCLGARRPLPVGQMECEDCDYVKRTYKCGGNCEMKIG